MQVRITVNGEQRQVREGSSLAELLAELGLHASAVAVERNQKLVRAKDLPTTALAAGDHLEVVTLVGGG